MSISFDGLEEVEEMLDGLLDDTRVRQALGKACALVVREAAIKAQVGRGTGDLARSIQFRVEQDGGTQQGVVFTPLEYAPYVEFGTGLFAEGGKGRKEVPWVYVVGSTKKSDKKTVYPTPADAEAAAAFLQSKGLNAVVTYGQHPHPFLRPALNENREEIKRILKEGLTND